jgi:hypothetical protein
MSTSFTPSKDLILQAKVPQVPSLFTTFATGHFVKPGKFTQPVKPAAVKPETFAGAYCEVFAAAPLDLDYDEPNAVTDLELEVVQPESSRHQIEVQVAVATSQATASVEVVAQRVAA